jgi:hypothetical protein
MLSNSNVANPLMLSSSNIANPLTLSLNGHWQCL